ncbi:FGGY-family carbohydrate kinase [Paraburkholderia kirstenboschensis]|uniref:FGGY-family carbohydrate kinase n=1 Tax=Paraburkholderia kirstenboschensis TaxID=1245436 RepID=A0ABZ0ECU9_9BURK|nr:FGGY-family carbohydrate kinase [Paraburkholderia kirstenboschensis]WOD15064.1 FGGY-family carbohydrate kinase [Paraburkholderia kirstenboschensis]
MGAEGEPEACLAYVFGTSSCTMTTTREPVFVPGVWGPYFSAMVPNAWLNEGGQSVAGAAIERLLTLHPATAEARSRAEEVGQSLPAMLANLATQASHTLSDVVKLAQGVHVVPEFLGNRAPFADPHARAVIAGLGMETDLDSLVSLYIAGICSIGYCLRQIIETQASAGAPIERVMISGGAGRHDLVRQLLADATGKPVLATRAEEPVLLGAAILGAVAGGQFGDVQTAMGVMSHVNKVYEPHGDISALHNARFGAFTRLQAVAREIG